MYVGELPFLNFLLLIAELGPVLFLRQIGRSRLKSLSDINNLLPMW